MGPVERFEIDLSKNLNVIYGGNNIGKSYAMQVVYLLLKYFSRFLSSDFAYMRMYPSDETAEKTLDNFISSDLDNADITSLVRNHIHNEMLNECFDPFWQACKNTFGNLPRENTQSTLCIEHDEQRIVFDLSDRTLSSNYQFRQVILKKRRKGSRNIWRQVQKTTISFIDDRQATLQSIYYELNMAFYGFLENYKFLDITLYYLPASRSGIYYGLSSFGPIMAELAKNRTSISRKIEIPGIAEPIADYYSALAGIRYPGNRFCAEDTVQAIERDIMKGEIRFDRDKSALRFASEDMELDLTQTSSMVSEISLITAFFKYIVASDNFLESRLVFIEEPEAHLHPENQVRFIELLADLSISSPLVISSHSNYIFNKLNNMVLDGKLDGIRYDPILLSPGETGSVAKHMEVTELGVEDENFYDVTDELLSEREAIIERLNEAERDDS